MEESAIYINDIIMRCLLKWRIALICMILGAAALSAFGVYRQQKAKAAEEEIPVDETTEYANAVAEAEEKLTATQIAEVYNVLDRYTTYQKGYKQLYNYYFNSIIGQIDATSVDTVTFRYLIDTHYEVVYPQIDAQNFTNTVFSYITSGLVDKELCSKISFIIGEELQEEYISQLVSSWQSNNLLMVTVKGRSREECTQIAGLVKDKIDKLQAEAKALIIDFDMKFLSEKYTKQVDTGLLDSQYNQITKINTYQNAMNSSVQYLSEAQRILLKTLALSDPELKELDEAAAEENQEEQAELEGEDSEAVSEEAAAAEIDYIQPQYILAGAFLGLLLVGGCVLLSVFLSGRLLTQNDMRDAFKLSRLGTWTAGKEPKGIDKRIFHVFGGDGVQFSVEESRSMAVAGIRLLAVKNEYKDLYITGTSNDEISRAEAEKLAGAVSGTGLNAKFGRSILYDPESLEAMSVSDAVILLERIDESKNSEIEEEVRVCGRQQVPVLGYIAIR
ncbi:MAG: hypothetical protein IJJ25_06410 [Lachnospiraceae bacterium]|nr:hypothetical protein [Lachnospiraceae bacterium]